MKLDTHVTSTLILEKGKEILQPLNFSGLREGNPRYPSVDSNGRPAISHHNEIKALCPSFSCNSLPGFLKRSRNSRFSHRLRRYFFASTEGHNRLTSLIGEIDLKAGLRRRLEIFTEDDFGETRT